MAKKSTPPAAKAELQFSANEIHAEIGKIIARELMLAEHVIQHGPNGTGWRHNEVLRPAAEERVALLRAAYQQHVSL